MKLLAPLLLLAAAVASAAPLSAQGGGGLQPPPDPPGNPTTAEKALLGKALFWDEQLSSTRTVACGTCHALPTGGSDPRTVIGDPRSTHPGADGVFGNAARRCARTGSSFDRFAGGRR